MIYTNLTILERLLLVKIINQVVSILKGGFLLVFCSNCGKENINEASFCQHCGDKLLSQQIKKISKKKLKALNKMEEKQEKYGFLIGAKGLATRLELYDYFIRISDAFTGRKYDYLIKDIISVTLKEPGYTWKHKNGGILFHIKDINMNPGGGIVTYGSSGVNFGFYGGNRQPTAVLFNKEWLDEFKKIKDIVETKISRLHKKELEGNY